MIVEFVGGPRDGEYWNKPMPVDGRYWFDRTIPTSEGSLKRSDLYEARSGPCPGWHYISTKEGHHKT